MTCALLFIYLSITPSFSAKKGGRDIRLRRFQKLVLVILTLVLATLSWPAFAAIEDEQDRSHIDVEKTFTGITLNQVPDDLVLAIHHGDTVYQLLPSINHEDITLTDVFEADGSVTFHWHIQHLAAGEYTLTESNPDVPGYQVAVSGLGTQQLEAASLIFTDITQIHQQVMKKGFPMDESSIFIGRMNASVGTVIVTLNTMNSSERLAIENYVTSHGSYKSPYYFFSVQEQLTEENPTFTVNGKTVEYSFSEGTIFFQQTNMWSNADQSSMHYETDHSHADFRVTNVYTPYMLRVAKQVSGTLGDKNQQFPFTVTLPEFAGETLQTELNGVKQTITLDAQGTASFSLSHGGLMTIKNVEGPYTVTETDHGSYFTSVSLNAGEAASGTTLSGEIIPGDNYVLFTNTLDAPLPAGISDSVGIALAGLMLAGALMLIRRLGGGCARHE